MHIGFIISLSLHALALVFAIVTIQSAPIVHLPETVAISVAIVTPSDVTRMKQGDQNTKNLESKAADKPSDDNSTKEAAKPKAAAAPPAPAPPPPPEPAKPEPPKPEPPKPEPAKAEPPPPDPIEQKLAALPPEPTPGPTPAELAAEAANVEAAKKAAEAKAKADAAAKAKADAAAKAKADAAKKAKADAAAKAKAEADQKKFDPSKIAEALAKAEDAPQKALLDKSNKPTGAKPTGDSKTATNGGPSAGTKEGRDTVLSAREADMLGSLLQSQVTANYRLPAGGGALTTPTVQVRFRLKPDGTLDGEPEVLQRQNSPQFGVAAEAAVRAIKSSSPFKLPADKFAGWQDNKIEFDVSKMLQ